MKKDSKIITAIIFLVLVLYTLTLRGAFGIPGIGDFKENLEKPSGAFELSPERGRYVHVVALAEKGDFALTRDWADVAYPDVGVAGGKFYSFFAPGVAYFAVPFYLIGAKFNLAQVAVFFMEIIIGAISAAFIYKIARNIFALSAPASFFSVLVFAFASSAWNYSITLYQHLFTVLFMTTAFYAAWKFRNESGPYSRLYASWVWAAYALSIFVDYPNAAMMLPIMLYFAYSTFSVKKLEEGVAISIKWAAIATVIVFVLAMSFQFWHNAHYYGSWLQLAGGIAGYHKEIPINMESPEQTQDIGAFFSERNIPKGFYVLLFSDERGLFFFYPIFILSLFGTRLFWKKSRDIGIRAEYILALSLIFVNLALYSSWGDPWGGWAYGPRYLIPSMAFLSIFAGAFISGGVFTRFKKNLALLLFLYSSAIALLGALTSNAIPTKSEAILLPAHKHNFLLNLDFLNKNQSSSFIYNTYFDGKFSLEAYYLAIYIVIALAAVLTLLVLRDKNHG